MLRISRCIVLGYALDRFLLDPRSTLRPRTRWPRLAPETLCRYLKWESWKEEKKALCRGEEKSPKGNVVMPPAGAPADNH